MKTLWFHLKKGFESKFFCIQFFSPKQSSLMSKKWTLAYLNVSGTYECCIFVPYKTWFWCDYRHLIVKRRVRRSKKSITHVSLCVITSHPLNIQLIKAASKCEKIVALSNLKVLSTPNTLVSIHCSGVLSWPQTDSHFEWYEVTFRVEFFEHIYFFKKHYYSWSDSIKHRETQCVALNESNQKDQKVEKSNSPKIFNIIK